MEVMILNHWTAREVPNCILFHQDTILIHCQSFNYGTAMLLFVPGIICSLPSTGDGLFVSIWVERVPSSHMGFPGGSVVKNPPAKQETWVRSLGCKMPWRIIWQPTLTFFLEKSHGQRSLAGYSPWGHKELDTA